MNESNAIKSLLETQYNDYMMYKNIMITRCRSVADALGKINDTFNQEMMFDIGEKEVLCYTIKHLNSYDEYVMLAKFDADLLYTDIDEILAQVDEILEARKNEEQSQVQ